MLTAPGEWRCKRDASKTMDESRGSGLPVWDGCASKSKFQRCSPLRLPAQQNEVAFSAHQKTGKLDGRELIAAYTRLGEVGSLCPTLNQYVGPHVVSDFVRNRIISAYCVIIVRYSRM